MAAPSIIYVNPVVGESFAVDIDPANGIGSTAGIDLSTVTAAAFAVLKPDGTTVITWSPVTLSNQTATKLTMTHNFVGTTDANVTGPMVLEVTLTLPGGGVRMFCLPIQVAPRFAVV